MRSIEVDEDVYAYLINNIVEFGEEANDVLRRLLGLKNQETALPAELTKARSQKATTENKRKPQARLSELVDAGFLKKNQLLFLFFGEDLVAEAQIRGDKLIWDNKSWSMSALALHHLREHGFNYAAARGPAFWFASKDEDGKSIAELWDAYLEGAS